MSSIRHKTGKQQPLLQLSPVNRTPSPTLPREQGREEGKSLSCLRERDLERGLRLIGVSVLLILLAACSGDNEASDPTPPPTPTEFAINFTGPVLAGSEEDHSEHGGGCSEDSGCVSADTQVITEAADAMPLAVQEINGITVGIPEGYSAQKAGNQVFISAVSPDEVGGFSVMIRPVEEAEVPELTERYGFEAGTTVENDTLEGTFVIRGDSRALALLTAPNGQTFLVDALSNPGYWLGYEATFFEMLRTLSV